jgi:hypothetical protein
MPDARINRPGAPTNPPHTAREGTAMSDYHPTDDDGAPPVHDGDPHPSDEGKPYAGDQNPPGDGHAMRDRDTPRYFDISPNPAIHTGSPEPKPDNADHGPKFAPS